MPLPPDGTVVAGTNGSMRIVLDPSPRLKARDSRLEKPRSVVPLGLADVNIGRVETSPDKHVSRGVDVSVKGQAAVLTMIRSDM